MTESVEDKFAYTVTEAEQHACSGVLRRKIEVVCPDCHTPNVSTRAYVVWDTNKQDWIIEDMDWDWIWCNECQEEIWDIEEKVID